MLIRILPEKASEGATKDIAQTTFTHEPPHTGQACVHLLIHHASRSFVGFWAPGCAKAQVCRKHRMHWIKNIN
jgi:hypothetical protein